MKKPTQKSTAQEFQKFLMRAQQWPLDQQGEYELVLDKGLLIIYSALFIKSLFFIAPAIMVHGCSVAQLVFVLAFQP